MASLNEANKITIVPIKSIVEDVSGRRNHI